jgi:hypothetical protein
VCSGALRWNPPKKRKTVRTPTKQSLNLKMARWTVKTTLQAERDVRWAVAK